MTDPDCQRYMEDPEAHAEHLATCESCGAMESRLGELVDAEPLTFDELPLAPWEGARHRAWPLVLVGGSIVLALAFVLFRMAGVSPQGALTANLPLIGAIPTVIRLLSAAVQRVPPGMQIILLISFVVINAVFVLLLRRAPRGLDV